MKVYVSQFSGVATISVLPLAAGLLVSTARRDPRLTGVLDAHIIMDRPDPAAAVEVYTGAPDVLAFSLYTWNTRYTLEVARRAHARFPEALVVLGGPSVPRRLDAVARFLDAHPFVSALVLGEGERSFCDLLAARLQGEPLTEVAGLALPGDDGPILTLARPRMGDFLATGSPYLDGTFDVLHEARHALLGGAVIETNRGCPFSCTFCDWGQATQSRVYELPLERVLGELDWLAERKTPFLYIIDANFGIRKRDVSIIEHIVGLKQRTGYPTYVYFHLTKNAHVRNLKTVELLREAGIGCQMALSMQDFDADVLGAIKRSNIKLERALHLRKLCNARGIPTFNELLLGLPEQTYGSFCHSMIQAMTPYPGDYFNLYLCRLLENAEMASPEHRARFGLETVEVTAQPHMTSYATHIDEVEEVIVATRAMPVEAWERSFRFGYLLGAFYNLDLLRVVLYNLQFVLGLDVRGYIDHLIEVLNGAEKESALGRLAQVFERYTGAVQSGEGLMLEFEGIEDHRWSIMEALLIAALSHHEAFFREVREATWGWLQTQPEAPDAVWLAELFTFQRLLVASPGSDPVEEVIFTYDWYDQHLHIVEGNPVAAATRPTTVRVHAPWYCGDHAQAAFFRSHLSALRARAATVRVERVE